MRLRALHLGNVRKFAGQRASITGIGDGITVVSEANEFGKSTFFDALHAVFFEKHSSAAKPVKSLQPYAKGAVEIAAEIETDAGLFRIEKSFVQRKSARILRLPGEVLVAQDDEAERWIGDALGSGKNGPAGLLWVRQGVTDLEADTRDETAQQLETRRDLLSSVSGEIDAMTGGRRMDRVMRRVAEDLKRLVTATGKPTGEWRVLTLSITDMTNELSDLDAQIAKLSAALGARKQSEEQLVQLDRPDARSARAVSLAQAQEAAKRAEAFAGRIANAQQSLKLAQIESKATQDRLDVFLIAGHALVAAEDAAVAARLAVQKADAEEAACSLVLREAQAARRAGADALTLARKRLDAARRQERARAAKTTAEDLNKRLQQVDEAQKNRASAEARMQGSIVTPAWMRVLEEAAQDVQAKTAAQAAQATTLEVSYTSNARVTRDGAPVVEGRAITLHGVTDFTLPGIGSLRVSVPDARGGDADLAASKRHLDTLLEAAGASSVQDARTRAAARAKAEQEFQTAVAILATLAPNGSDALRAEKAAADLAAAEGDAQPLPELVELEADLREAETLEATSQARLGQAESAFAAAREASIRAQAAAQTAEDAKASAMVAAGPEAEREQTLNALLRAQAQGAKLVEEAAETIVEMQADAPDVGTSLAELTRAEEAVRAAEGKVQELLVRIAALSAEIAASSENGIEEMRETLAGRLEFAQAQEARFAQKAEALTRLQGAMETERLAARDMYFGPVQAELQPLLAILHAEAELEFDPDSLLPSGLKRSETEEDFARLSGGTREQIAILTRLAFARLFKEQGQHIPIVLDDALVFSDDARIVKMFTALTRVAQDQQILVFTCRTMAFLELGGTRPEVMIRDL